MKIILFKLCCVLWILCLDVQGGKLKAALWTDENEEQISLVPSIADSLSDPASIVSNIVGGTTSATDAWPYQLSLQENSTGNWLHICGAVLISKDYALTAAHCVIDIPASSLRLMMGSNVQPTSAQAIHVSIRGIVIHEMYTNSIPFICDIAILHLDTRAVLSQSNVGIIPLSTSTQVFETRTCYVMGWGQTAVPGGSSSPLMEARLRVLTNQACKGYLPYMIVPTHICVFDGTLKKSSCFGDSGGPLVCKESGIWYLAGIASSVSNNCVGTPAIYTRIQHSMILSFIKKHMSSK